MHQRPMVETKTKPNQENKTTDRMKTNIETVERDITPAEASAILEQHYERTATGDFVQRRLKNDVVLRYAADMKSNHWLFTPQPIIFDDAQNLVDGQHRLEAVRHSGCTIRFMVSTGWPAKQNNGVGIIDVIDSGKRRSVVDMLAMHGQKYAGRYAGVVRNLALISHGQSSGLGLTYASCVYILDKLDIRSAITAILNKGDHLRDFAVPVVSCLTYYYTTKPRKALAFAEDLFNFTAEKGSPVQAFLSYNKTTRIPADRMRATASALRCYELGESRQVIKPTLEAIRWLRSTNEKLAVQIQALCPRS
jgi:hypothetical protein